MLLGGSRTPQAEDGESSLVGSVEILASERMFYSWLPALHDLSLGSRLWVFHLDSIFYHQGLCGFPRSTYWA